MPIYRIDSRSWTTIQRDEKDGMPGARFLMANRHRRLRRLSLNLEQLEIVNLNAA